MPHDGQDITMTQGPLVDDLLATTKAALPAVYFSFEKFA